MAMALSLGDSKKIIVHKDERGARETREFRKAPSANDLTPQAFAQHTRNCSPRLDFCVRFLMAADSAVTLYSTPSIA